MKDLTVPGLLRNSDMISRKHFISVFALILLLGECPAWAQFPPPAGQPGSTAIYKDSSDFVEWADGCSIVRGLRDISNPGLGYAVTGDSSMAMGMAGSNGVVSLGDGGNAILTFLHPIVNGDGWDFAVFENSFADYFLELAFVEVSSDGLTYYRFPATSLTDTNVQTGAFDSLDATKINNLAGKYRALYGTPFDLEELKNEAGLNVNHITHVKIIDVVGSLNPAYANYDKDGRKINDPWPTGFESGGFDLDAVGVIWNTANAVPRAGLQDFITLYPNPVKDHFYVLGFAARSADNDFRIFDITGNQVPIEITHAGEERLCMDLSRLKSGVYFLHIISGHQHVIKKVIKL